MAGKHIKCERLFLTNTNCISFSDSAYITILETITWDGLKDRLQSKNPAIYLKKWGVQSDFSDDY